MWVTQLWIELNSKCQLKTWLNDQFNFDADKINELLDCKYYWKSMIKNVKKYINTCDIY